MEEKIMEVAGSVRPTVFSWIAAAIGFVAAWWTGLPALAQALLIVQAADILTGLLCAFSGKSTKTESGRINSSVLAMGVVKKGLEWLVVLICVYVGSAVGMDNVSGAAMTYMIATELVSLLENLQIFGLDIPLLRKILDIAQGGDKDDDA
ncbi:MAG: phage holin family protein [Candidatus Spyradocola sp.]